MDHVDQEIQGKLDDHEERIVDLEATWDPWAERLSLWQTIARFTVRAVKWIGGLAIGAAALVEALRRLRQ